MRAVRDHSRSLVEDPDRLDGVAALDLDETSFLRARTAPTPWITGLVALEGGPLLDVWPTAPGLRWMAGLVSDRTAGRTTSPWSP